MPENSFGNQEKTKALDELFASSAKYRTSKKYLELLNFINKFPPVSPFNAFLIDMQNNGVEIVKSASQWEKIGRRVKLDSRPLLILVPFGPVEFVYDIADTEGEEIPDDLKNPFHARGEFNQLILDTSILNCAKENILYEEITLNKNSAGYVRPIGKNQFKITVNKSYDCKAKYSTLVHELAHVYSGHLGKLTGLWWKERRNLDKAVEEIEAESISYLVCKRFGLETNPDSYLSTYIKDDKEMPDISLDIILTVAGYIEQLSQKDFRSKSAKKLSLTASKKKRFEKGPLENKIPGIKGSEGTQFEIFQLF